MTPHCIVDMEHRKNVVFEEFLPILKSNLYFEDEATEKNDKSERLN